MIKLFISQPMYSANKDKILAQKRKERAIENTNWYIKHITGKEEEIEILENFNYDNAPEDAGVLWYLGRDTQLLDKADYIYFGCECENEIKCLVEEFIAAQYNIKIIREIDIITGDIYKTCPHCGGSLINLNKNVINVEEGTELFK